MIYLLEPFICARCPRQFARYDHVIAHFRTHQRMQLKAHTKVASNVYWD